MSARHEYLVTWRREDGKVRRKLYQTEHGAECFFQRLYWEYPVRDGGECYAYRDHSAVGGPSATCLDLCESGHQVFDAAEHALFRSGLADSGNFKRPMTKEDLCVICAGNVARDVRLMRRTVAPWEEIRKSDDDAERFVEGKASGHVKQGEYRDD